MNIQVKFDNDDFSTILPELCAFLYFKFPYFWFPDDNLWAKSQMCGMLFWHFLLKLLITELFQYLNL
jgi:hypothetical protein